jgi:hypothetical protein
MRHRGVSVVGAAVCAGLSIVGCSGTAPDPTTVVFDGDTYTLDGAVECARQVDRRLIINAPVAPKFGGGNPGGNRRLIRVELTDEFRLAALSVGIRIDNRRGFVNDPAEMWVTKADDVYTINGRMPPSEGELQSHQFKIELTCAVEEQRYHDVGPPPLGVP